MLDGETLRPVAIAMALYLLLVNLIPRMITKPTGVQVIDDIVMYSIAQRGFYMSGAIVVGLVMYLSNYTIENVL